MLYRPSRTSPLLPAGIAVMLLAVSAHAQAPADGPIAVPFFDRTGTPYGVAIQPDGRIVAAGSVPRAGGADTDFAVMRFNADGTPDGTFGSAGRVTTDFSATNDVARAVAIQTDGAIVVAVKKHRNLK